MVDYKFRLDVAKLRPLLQRDLYKDPRIIFRELPQNANDAIKRRAEKDQFFDAIRDGRIRFKLDNASGTLVVEDNGIGISEKALKETFRWYGRTDKDENQVGGFGLGAKSIFALADSFTIHTRTKNEEGLDETHFVYATFESLSFEAKPPPRSDLGTTIVIPIGAAPAIEREFALSEKQNETDEEHVNASNIRRYCHFMKIPVYVTSVEGEEELISQKLPWPEAAAAIRIPSDGFEVYLRVRQSSNDRYYLHSKNYAHHWWRSESSSAPALYTDGIFVCTTLTGVDEKTLPADIAVNLTRRGVINLTMGRDSPIEDEKFTALIRNVYATIADAVNKKLRERPADMDWARIAEWTCRNSTIWKHLEPDIQETIKELHSDVYAYSQLVSAWSDQPFWAKHKLLLVELLKRKLEGHSVFQAIGKRVDTIAKKANGVHKIIVIYGGTASKEVLRKWASRFQFPEYDVEKIPRRHTVFLSGVREHLYLADLGRYVSSSSPLMIFPKRTKDEILSKISMELGCGVIKLGEDETLALDQTSILVDLRQEEGRTVEGIYRGEQITERTVLRHVHVAPTYFYALASPAKDLPIVFPKDLKSACLLRTVHELPPVDSSMVKAILEAALPSEETHETLERFISFHDDVSSWQREHDGKQVVELIDALDWTNPYAALMLKRELVPDYDWDILKELRKMNGKKIESAEASAPIVVS